MKFCTPLEDSNAHIRARRNFEFPPLKNFAPLWILRLHYGQCDEDFKSALLEFPKLFWADIFRRRAGCVKAYFEIFANGNNF